MPLSTPKDNTDEHWAAQVCRVWNGTVTLLHKAYPPLPSLTWTIPYPCTGLLKQGGCCSIRQSQWVLNHKVNISAKSFSSHRINLKFPQGNQNPILTNDQEREEQKIFSKKNFSNKKADQRLSLAIHFNLCPAAPLPPLSLSYPNCLNRVWGWQQSDKGDTTPHEELNIWVVRGSLIPELRPFRFCIPGMQGRVECKGSIIGEWFFTSAHRRRVWVSERSEGNDPWLRNQW